MKLLEGWIDQQQCVGDYGWTEAQRLLTLQEIAESMVGMKPLDPKYLSALYPWDTDADAKSMAKGQYKCALTGLGVLRAYGKELPYDTKPYRSSLYGKIPDAITQIRTLPEWEDASVLPQPGEGCIITKRGNSMVTHYLTCVSIDGDRITSVDGGFGDVCLTEREIIVSGKNVYLKDNKVGIREIIGVLHSGRMMPERNWVLP